MGTGSRCPGAMRAVGWGASLAWNPFPSRCPGPQHPPPSRSQDAIATYSPRVAAGSSRGRRALAACASPSLLFIIRVDFGCNVLLLVITVERTRLTCELSTFAPDAADPQTLSPSASYVDTAVPAGGRPPAGTLRGTHGCNGIKHPQPGTAAARRGRNQGFRGSLFNLS